MSDNVNIEVLITDADEKFLSECRMCPRKCGANRFEKSGACGAGANLKIASANLHFGEEPPISGFRGSGTIFLSHCNLHCIYCQNFPISQMGTGKVYSISKLVDTMLWLQKKDAHNINFVTPSHYVVQIRRAIIEARKQGLIIPIVYNTSGYDCPDALEMLDGLIEVFMPDLRYFDSQPAQTLSRVFDYPKISRDAVKTMHSQVGNLILDKDGVATRGILIRLLVLPDNLSGTDKTLRWIADNLGIDTYISLMSQYFPAHKAHEHPPMNKRINSKVYEKIRRVMETLGFSRGFVQSM